jgi:methylated-DNA-[protein]-cysteine S-methyltransferase
MTPTMPDVDLRSALSDDNDDQILERLRGRLVSCATSDALLDISYRHLDTPVGDLLIAATGRGLVRIAYSCENHDDVLRQLAERISPRILLAPARLDQAAHELDHYFTGARKTFDLPLDLELASGFRHQVLEHLRQLDYGQTASYSAVARAVGNPKAVRAVGSACAHNPLPVIIPCHRVVRSDGTIGNYLGGPEAKLALLELERGFDSGVRFTYFG